MSDAYAAAGVDTDQSDRAVGALVDVLRTIDLGRASRSIVRSGHYASVLKVSDELGLAMSTDGVGSKLVLAEQADRLETVGIDCIAMNVNDIICAGCSGLARADFFVDGEKVLLNELNTMPGFTSTSVYASLWQQSGIEYPELCGRLLEIALARHREQSSYRF